jgi:hypothetical protein
MRKNHRLMDPAKCQTCDHDLPLERHPNLKFCEPCKKRRTADSVRHSVKKSGAEGAYAVMRLAIRLGLLAHPKNFSCVDCGFPAHAYDHRDYNKPLDVAPVCYTCNRKRGAALPFVRIDDTFLKSTADEKEAMELLMRDAACKLKWGRGCLDAPCNKQRAVDLGLIVGGKKAA